MLKLLIFKSTLLLVGLSLFLSADFIVRPPESAVNFKDVFNISQDTDAYFDPVYPNVCVLTDNTLNKKGVVTTKKSYDLRTSFTCKMMLYLGASKLSSMATDPNGYKTGGNGLIFTIDNKIGIEFDLAFDKDFDEHLENFFPHFAFINFIQETNRLTHLQCEKLKDVDWKMSNWNSVVINWAPENSKGGSLEVIINEKYQFCYKISNATEVFHKSFVTLTFSAKTSTVASALQAVALMQITD